MEVPMTTAVGFDGVKQKSQEISTIIRDVARLVGERGAQPLEIEIADGELIAPGLNMVKDAKSLLAQSQAIDEGIFTIIVAGTFKNGKSTLLNALLGAKQLPAGAAPTTGVITMLVYGESDVVQVYEYEKSEPRLFSLEEFFDEYRLKTEDADELKEFRFQNVRYARMECQHPICAKGVRLVDSPGLGEHTSRSELTTNFLRESQAVILVLDASHLLGKEEREFILEQLGTGRLDHVFFVVNRINQIDSDDVPDLHQRARRILRPHFLDQANQFDQQRFNERVFWVNARDALKARQARPPNLQLLDTTGVPMFEQHVEVFLTDEQMFQAGMTAAMRTMTEAVRKGIEFIKGEKLALEKPLDDLIERRDRAGKQLDELERRCSDIEEIIARTGTSVQLQLQLSLHTFIDQLEKAWPQDIEELLNKMDEITLVDTATAALRPAVRDKIGKIVKNVIEEYLRQKFEQWSVTATTITQQEVDKLRTQLQERIDEFVVKLNQARSEFTGDTSVIVQEQREIAVSISTGIFAGGTGLWGIIGGMLRRLTLLLLLLSISTIGLFGWALLIVLIAAEVGIIKSKKNDFKRGMLNLINRRIIKGLRVDLQSDDFSIANLTNLPGLLQQLNQRSTSIDQFIWRRLSPESQSALEQLSEDKLTNTEYGEEIARRFISDLNHISRAESIHNAERYAGITLPDETQRLLDRAPTGDDLHMLNRYLLVDAYPDFLAPKLKDTVSRTIQAQFVSVAKSITSDLRAEIAQLRLQMDTTIATLQQETFSVERERQRLDRISQKLVELLNAASTITTGRVYTIEDFQIAA
jgi:GTP-binding protein EngB required for normal cell division